MKVKTQHNVLNISAETLSTGLCIRELFLTELRKKMKEEQEK